MARGPRNAPGGVVYHALNRGVARLPLFEKPADYEAFLRILGEALQKQPIRILAFILMPNHWHFLLWPKGDQELTNFCRWLTHTHSMRWHAHYHTRAGGTFTRAGSSRLRCKRRASFRLGRYVERNAFTSGLRRRHSPCCPSGDEALLSPWPLALPDDWVERVNAPQTEAELEALRKSLLRGCPFGAAGWQKKMAARQGLAHTLRPRGRPPKKPGPLEGGLF